MYKFDKVLLLTPKLQQNKNALFRVSTWLFDNYISSCFIREMKIWVLNKIVPLRLFSWYLTFIFHLSPAVSKIIHICLIFPWKQRYLVAYIGEGNKSHTKWTNLDIINTLKPKVYQKVPSDLKLKTAISHFVFQIFPVNKLQWFVSSNWIYSLMKNKSVKLQFVAKNSKHLVGTSGDDSSTLIEFTPLWKTRVSNYPLKLKKRNLIGCL